MIRRSTIVYLVLLLALVGVYYYLNNRAETTADTDGTATTEPTVEVSYLFPAEEGTPSSIRMESKSGETVGVERDAANAWMLTQPIEAKAEPGSAEAAASQITTIRILDRVPDVDPDVVGLEIPEYILTVNFTGGVERSVDIGTITPSESGYYVRDADGKIVIVSRDAIDSLLGLLQNPPYLETPTPSPIPATVVDDTPTGEIVTPQP